MLKAKKEFVYSVLLRSIQTLVERGAVRKHGSNKDAQKAWIELKKEQESLTAAQLGADKHMAYLTTVKLDPATHRNHMSHGLHTEKNVLEGYMT